MQSLTYAVEVERALPSIDDDDDIINETADSTSRSKMNGNSETATIQSIERNSRSLRVFPNNLIMTEEMLANSTLRIHDDDNCVYYG
jgi:hypothetical protein